MSNVLLLFACLLILTGCPLSQNATKTPPPQQSVDQSVSQGDPSMAQETGTTVTTASGLQYIDQKIGTGVSPQKGQKVTVHYTGTLTDGKKFDSSKDRGTPFQFTIGVGQVIKGWDEGVSTMKVGGARKLIIPSNLAYGDQGVPGAIPAKATLNFDVELLDVK